MLSLQGSLQQDDGHQSQDRNKMAVLAISFHNMGAPSHALLFRVLYLCVFVSVWSYVYVWLCCVCAAGNSALGCELEFLSRGAEAVEVYRKACELARSVGQHKQTGQLNTLRFCLHIIIIVCMLHISWIMNLYWR